MSEALTFWDHLDELRTSLFRIICAVALFAVIAFVMKEELFGIILAPRSSDFITYRLLGTDDFSIHLMNTGLTEQFMIHMQTAIYAGLLMGLINGNMMSTYRRHALVAILIVAAIITPTTDVFTLFVVALPIYLLYEISILIVRKVN